jgi:hypothetical protein
MSKTWRAASSDGIADHVVAQLRSPVGRHAEAKRLGTCTPSSSAKLGRDGGGFGLPGT